MKARRRHELKENVLAQELGRLKTFLSRYGNWLLAGAAAVLIVILVLWYWHGRTREQVAGEKAKFERLAAAMLRQAASDQPEGMSELAAMTESAKDPTIAAGAAVFLGDFSSRKYLDALLRSAGSEGRLWRERAEKYYRLVLQRHADLKLLAAEAHLGLGVLGENDGDVKGAEAAYRQVAGLADPVSPVALEARRRLENLSRWSEPVPVATTTQATTTQATQATRPVKDRPASLPATLPAGR